MVSCSHLFEGGPGPETALARDGVAAPIRCSRCGTEFVERATVAHLEAEARELRKALQEIRSEGKVCEQYEICSHVSCSSSYAAWAIADAALASPSGAEPGRESGEGE